MSEMQSTGSLNSLVRRQNIPSGEAAGLVLRERDGIAHEEQVWAEAGWHSLPAALPAMMRAEGENAAFWSSVFALFVESLALCGASLHGSVPFPVESCPGKAGVSQLKESSSRERRRHLSLVASLADPGMKAVEPESGMDRTAFRPVMPSAADDGPTARHGFASLEMGRSNRWNWLTSPWKAVVARRARRRRERQIRQTVTALAELDDRTLRDIGILHRSQIEEVVRYCHDC